MKNPIFVVLAEGVDTDFAPLVTTKLLFPFLGKPFIAHVLEMIHSAGSKEVIIVCNKTNRKTIENISFTNMRIKTVVHNESSSQADAFRKVAKLVPDDQPIIIINGVELIDPLLLKNFIKKASKTYAQIMAMKVSEHFPGDYLEVAQDRVISINENLEKSKDQGDIVNLFFHYYSKPREILDLVAKQNEGDDIYKKALNELMKRRKVEFMIYEGYWQKLKAAHHVLDISKLFLKYKLKNRIDPSVQIDSLAKIEGPVQIEAGVKVLVGAVIKGPAYIGANVIIGNHSLVRDSIIEANTVIGFGSEIARSYVGSKCNLHHNFIGDSVLEEEVNPSYGTCTANLRFDGSKVKMRLLDGLVDTNKDKLGAIMAKGVFLGINCSILPGITLGEKSTAMPGSVIDKAVKAKEMFRKI